MRPNRHVRSLSTEEHETLRSLYRQTDDADLRTRTQMILLSAQGWSPGQIGAATFYNEDTVLFWIERFESHHLEGLKDRPRSGRPAKSHA